MSRYDDFEAALAALADAGAALVPNRRGSYTLTAEEVPEGSGALITFDIGKGSARDIRYRWESPDGYTLHGSVRVDPTSSPVVMAIDRPFNVDEDDGDEYWDAIATAEADLRIVAHRTLTAAVVGDHVHALTTYLIEFEAAQIQAAVTRAKESAERLQATLVEEQVRMAKTPQERDLLRAAAGHAFRGDPEQLATAVGAAVNDCPDGSP